MEKRNLKKTLKEDDVALIHWNDAMSVNVGVIDDQHKQLIAMINQLNDAMLLGKGNEVLGKIISSLVAYTVTHFKLEETYFAQFKYPGTQEHMEEHASFVKKAMQLKEDFEKKKLSITIDVMDFLSDWLKNHIMGTDKKYSGFFNANGLK